jgi:hypothetical protein
MAEIDAILGAAQVVDSIEQTLISNALNASA